ncbi:F-box/FBD/LRR-repeat protein At1g13570-like isoform X1 [Solanum tuberosum]|uniref:F-box/FBD/LRR-repeat protein At1g13570-like isoform X1 n=1 Tax=Solanum tuberosum TaxID=4113 RepID=UPI0003D25A51|nr:PREDICTED: F-box/FBD/LRR-repeat protein At1g13570-like isoform X1 [Solanum tuberosum]XP_006365390.1 PREDICTED: F-box/FBD/LRR-repeat protein At1g13570-like isoform X1 [Solanum tuberosum]XP_015159903.1 PREDICTED: F-box/FBD/LRR-repeat protein At1g13570-like isoform X1 [Solanum tuberosum]XP_015159904.1 PREDICTED: F-box/FBD/LRR-repeat protein At1g13570-like isoform X1 [Solanum tuberosum]
MRNAWTSDVDTISNLPCNVLDGILGCLPWKDAVKTSILSKDWRYKWVTRQELDFNDEFFKSFKQDEEAKRIIYQVLLVHQGPILKFRLCRITSCPDIDHWMHFLSKKNVQEFTLHVSLGNKYHSPHHLFTFQQLRFLELQDCLFHPPLGFKGFEKLINLDLVRVTFDPSIFTNLISKSPLLERLRLRCCTNLDILEIDAANLKFYEFIGKTKSISFRNAPMLEKVTVAILGRRLLTDTSPVCSNFPKFFYYMPSLLELEICGTILEYLIKGGLPESPPTALNNIKSLTISSMSLRNAQVVSSAVYLISSCPKLQDLTLEFYQVWVGDIVEPVVQLLRAQSSSYGVVKLQRVRVNMFTGLEMEMEFMKFILASALVLEEIFIWNCTCFLFRSCKQMIDEMKEFRRASPNVEFTFEEIGMEGGSYEREEVMEVP